MWGSILLALQILKVFLELWREKDAKEAAKKSEQAKEIVDAFAKADPAEKASALNATITDIRSGLRDK